MTIHKAQTGSALTVTLDGRLDTITSPDLEQALTDLTGITHLTLDFTKITYVSSAGLRVILATQKQMNHQGSMVVANVSDTIMNIFEMTGFTDILTIQ